MSIFPVEENFTGSSSSSERNAAQTPKKDNVFGHHNVEQEEELHEASAAEEEALSIPDLESDPELEFGMQIQDLPSREHAVSAQAPVEATKRHSVSTKTTASGPPRDIRFRPKLQLLGHHCRRALLKPPAAASRQPISVPSRAPNLISSEHPCFRHLCSDHIGIETKAKFSTKTLHFSTSTNPRDCD
ncbi:hypothetical protein NDU88_005416 [Pleurodeles waltl]|uniref:Uncharacterized protein n=1 Tax=Pleurodeles waltl TaxID=8319 RepID=A0AAV7QIZ4_PLEWA|nr:hypothetical protein NDU88_005416 [Pleurodeles waltl]